MQFIRSVMLISTLTLATLQPAAQAQSEIQAQFNSANEALVQEQFTQALSIFESIKDAGYESGPLYLNMGITATRLDSLGLAKYYYLNAQRFDDVSIAASDALDFVDYELGRRGARLPELAWTQFTRLIFFEMNHHAWLALGLFVINIGVVFLVASWLRQSYKKTNRYLSVVLLNLGTAIVLITTLISWQATGYKQGIQIVREAHVYALPDQQSEIVQTGFEGFQYIVDINQSASTPDWMYVRMSNGSRGWVRAGLLNLF
jgi:hypothetical protein